MYRFSEPEPSFWQASLAPETIGSALAGDTASEVGIIGAGYTGLSAALHLAREHGIEATVLDAGEIAWGASSRNGGFCCLYPSNLGLEALERRYGRDETGRFLASQCEAIDLVADLAHSENIDIQRQGGGICEVAHLPSRFEELRELGEAYKHYGIGARLYSRPAFAEFAYDSSEQFGGLHLERGFGLHPLAYARGLARAAVRHGARLCPHSEVLAIEREGGAWRLRTAGGSLRCQRLLIATNGYQPESLLAPLAGRTVPVISNIITTRPLNEAELAAQGWHTELPCSNTRRLLFYYRLLPDRRMLFGARGDTTGRESDAARMRAWLERRFGEVFPAWAAVETSHFWRGFVCLTLDGTAGIGEVDGWPGAWYAGAYHGNGVAAATWSGRELAALATGQRRIDSLPAVMRGPWRHIPLPALRPWYLRAALGLYRLGDAR